MALRRRSGSSWTNVGNVRRRSGSGWAQVQIIRRRVAGAWQVVWQYFTISAAPADGSVFLPEPAPSYHTVNAHTTVTVQGGLAPLSYSWTYVSGDSGISPTTGTTGANCSWSADVFKNSERSAVWRITVTDAIGSRSQNVTVSLSYHTDL